MRKFFISAIVALLSIVSTPAIAGSDDVMITRDGSFINVKVLRISNSDVNFINLDKKRQGELKAPTDYVYMIMKEKGSNVLFDEEGNQTTSSHVKIDKKESAQIPTSQTATTSLTSQATPSTQATPAVTTTPNTPSTSTGELKFSPATTLSDDEIVRRVYAKQPYTLYGKGTIAEYIIMKGDKQSQFMGLPTYVQQVVAEEKVSNGLLGVYVKQVLLNKKHEPSKGISASFKSYYYPTEIDTAGTFHLTHDISRDFYLLSSRQGYAMLLPSMPNVGDKLKCGTIADNSKNLFGGTVKLKAEYTDFYVDGTETVTTPAGTFNCIRLKGKVFEDNSAYKANYQYTWWLARGVGFVKYEIINVDGKDAKVPTTILLNKLERQ